MKPDMKAMLFLAGAALALAGCCTTPKILGDDGKALEGSIASLERIELNGRREWITLRGKDGSKPLLLFLAGGPGGSELATVRHSLPGLEEHFLVVVWDQPGAGKSYSAIRHAKLDRSVYLEDALALIEALCARFSREKVVLVGESWGSALALMVAQARPERIRMVFGTGQMVDFLEADLACYRLVLGWLKEKGETAKAAKLEKQGPPPYPEKGAAMKLAAFLMKTGAYEREELGVRTRGNTLGDIFSPEYSLIDSVNWFRGLADTMGRFYPKLWGLDLRKAIPRIDVPVCFLQGRLDVNSCLPVFEEYYAALQAPSKELVWFERSGHTPWSSESERFVAEIAARAGR